MDKKVSVIIPTYKRSEFLDRAISSVLNQTYSNIEVIVVDDNEPHSNFRLLTQEKMSKYATNERIIYERNERNLGGALARNQGINKATGDYITFLDDDDIYLPNKVSVQIEYMMKNNLDLTFSDVRIHTKEDKLVDYREHPYVKNCSNDELLKQHLLHHLTPTSTYMYKRDAILKVGGFDNVKVGQEFKLMLKSIEGGLTIGYIPQAHIIQYLHDGERISIGKNKIQGEKELYQFKKGYFKILNTDQKSYIKFRHHAVMMVVGMRSKKYKILLKHFFLAVITSPKYSLVENFSHIKKLYKHKSRRGNKKLTNYN